MTITMIVVVNAIATMDMRVSMVVIMDMLLVSIIKITVIVMTRIQWKKRAEYTHALAAEEHAL